MGRRLNGYFGYILGGKKMEYVEFKNYLYKRLRNEFGFKKEGKMHVFRNEDVKIMIDTQKSNYSNSAYVHVGINPKDVIENWGLKEPMTTEISSIGRPLVDGKTLYELDDMEFDEINKDIDEFFCNVFPHLVSVEKLKEFYKERQDSLMPFMRKFWYN